WCPRLPSARQQLPFISIGSSSLLELIRLHSWRRSEPPKAFRACSLISSEVAMRILSAGSGVSASITGQPENAHLPENSAFRPQHAAYGSFQPFVGFFSLEGPNHRFVTPSQWIFRGDA